MPRIKKQSTVTIQSPINYSQPNNKILYFMLGIITLFLVFMTVKVLNLEKQLKTGANTGTTAQQPESPLTVDKIKQYAKDLKFDTGKFNKCLDSGSKAKPVAAQESYGASLGVQGTPGFFINGKFLAGAFPFENFKEIIDKELAGTGSTNCTDYSQQLQQYCSDPQNQAFIPTPKTLDLSGAQVKGPANAKIQLVEFSDFECPFCIRAFPTVEKILNDYKGQVRFYYMQYPLTQLHPHAQKAAEASLCAADQGKFWELHDKLFSLEETQ